MLKLSSIGFLFFSLLLTSGAMAAENSQPPVFQNLNAGKPQTVVVYGTSLTAGGGWAVAMKKWFDATYPGLVTFVNSGGPGQNSDWGVQNLKTKVLDLKPDLVLVEFSYNDAHEKFKLPVERGAANLEKMVQGILTQNPETTVALQTMNVPWDPPGANKPAGSRPALEQYNDNYRTYARTHQLPLLDHYPVWLKRKESDEDRYKKDVPDGSHPSNGASIEVAWPTIESWLKAASGK